MLGSVNVDGVGRAGLELQYDALLAGEPGELVVERGPDGRTIPRASRQRRAGPAPATTSSSPSTAALQYEAEAGARRPASTQMGAHGGTVIVVEPAHRRDLAMANMTVPAGGGPAVPSRQQPGPHRGVRAGSVNKVITLAAALEEGIVTPTDRAAGARPPPGLRPHLHRPRPAPDRTWTPTDILATSSNIGTIMLAQELGAERVDEYLRRFGFGERTGLDFPDESGGLLLDVDDWSGTSIGSIPIGQGIAVTAMQMLAAYNVHRQRRRLRRAQAGARPPSTPRAARHDVAATGRATGSCPRPPPGRCAT